MAFQWMKLLKKKYQSWRNELVHLACTAIAIGFWGNWCCDDVLVSINFEMALCSIACFQIEKFREHKPWANDNTIDYTNLVVAFGVYVGRRKSLPGIIIVVLLYSRTNISNLIRFSVLHAKKQHWLDRSPPVVDVLLTCWFVENYFNHLFFIFLLLSCSLFVVLTFWLLFYFIVAIEYCCLSNT